MAGGRQQPDHNTPWPYCKALRIPMRNLRLHGAHRGNQVTGGPDQQAVNGTKADAGAADEAYSAAGLPEELANREAPPEQGLQAMAGLSGRKGRKRINLIDYDSPKIRTRPGHPLNQNAQATFSPVKCAGEMAGILVTVVDIVDDSLDSQRLTALVEGGKYSAGRRAPVTLADGAGWSVSWKMKWAKWSGAASPDGPQTATIAANDRCAGRSCARLHRPCKVLQSCS